VTLIAGLAADLASAGFSVDALEELWGTEAAAALARGRRLPAERALNASRNDDGNLGPLSSLAMLFVLGVPVAVDELARAIPSVGISGAHSLGLVEVDSAAHSTQRVRPLLDLRPYRFADRYGECAWWIASDMGEMALGHAIDPSHVLGIGGASTTLSGLMLADPVVDVLDLGTGCGIQALHASRHADRVIATDISPRAIAMARLNAELNGVTNIEFRLGNLFEPVADDQFDQIVSNPPFVITPRAKGVPAYDYRDGGMTGDALIKAVIDGAAVHLKPGGVAQFLGNWEYRVDQNGLDRVAGWFDDLQRARTPLDAWVIERERQDAASYAETWIRDGGVRPGTAEFERMYAAWLDDFDTRGVESVGFGYVTVRRVHDGRVGWRRFERVDSVGANAAGLSDHIGACMWAQDWLAGLDDDEFAASHLTVAGDVTEDRHYWPGDEGPTIITVQQGAGFGRSVSVDAGLAGVIGACDGELSVAAICGAVAHLLEVDEQALLTELVPPLRELVATGFLTPDSVEVAPARARA